MTREQVLAQLGAIRAICDALVAALLEEPAPAATAEAGCEHPENLRDDASTLRSKQFFCRQCKSIVDETTGQIIS